MSGRVSFFYGLDNFPTAMRGGVVIPGNFDGWHLGHRRLCQRAGAEFNLPITILTFEPHPREFFDAGCVPFRLTQGLENLVGDEVRSVVVLPFDSALAGMSAGAFVDDILVGALGAERVVIGYDFRFGKGRSGGVDEISAKLPVTVVDAELGDGGEIISSSLVRDLIVGGDVDRVSAYLGRDYSIIGEVVVGDKLGRDLGFPTANLALGRQLRPAVGVYVSRVRVGGKVYGGVTNYGFRPTVGGVEERFESFIFDFGVDIYGDIIEVFLLERLRGEIKFNNLDELKEQIRIDCESAKKKLKNL